MDDELKRMWKETFVTNFEGAITELSKGTGRNHENRIISSVWTRDLPNSKQEPTTQAGILVLSIVTPNIKGY